MALQRGKIEFENWVGLHASAWTRWSIVDTGSDGKADAYIDHDDGDRQYNNSDALKRLVGTQSDGTGALARAGEAVRVEAEVPPPSTMRNAPNLPIRVHGTSSQATIKLGTSSFLSLGWVRPTPEQKQDEYASKREHTGRLQFRDVKLQLGNEGGGAKIIGSTMPVGDPDLGRPCEYLRKYSSVTGLSFRNVSLFGGWDFNLRHWRNVTQADPAGVKVYDSGASFAQAELPVLPGQQVINKSDVEYPRGSAISVDPTNTRITHTTFQGGDEQRWREGDPYIIYLTAGGTLEGTCDEDDSSGTLLVDNSADFSVVQSGDIIENLDEPIYSFAFVTAVNGPGELTTDGLRGGTRTRKSWEVGDAYEVHQADVKWFMRSYAKGFFEWVGGEVWGIQGEHLFYTSLTRTLMRYRNVDCYFATRTMLQQTNRAESTGDDGIPGWGSLELDYLRIRDVSLESQGGGWPISLKGRFRGRVFIRKGWTDVGNTKELGSKYRLNITGGILITHKAALSDASKNPEGFPNKQVLIDGHIVMAGGTYGGTSAAKRACVWMESGGAEYLDIRDTTLLDYHDGEGLILDCVDTDKNRDFPYNSTREVRLDVRNYVRGDCAWSDFEYGDSVGYYDNWVKGSRDNPGPRRMYFRDPDFDGSGYRDMLVWLNDRKLSGATNVNIVIYDSEDRTQMQAVLRQPMSLRANLRSDAGTRYDASATLAQAFKTRGRLIRLISASLEQAFKLSGNITTSPDRFYNAEATLSQAFDLDHRPTARARLSQAMLLQALLRRDEFTAPPPTYSLMRGRVTDVRVESIKGGKSRIQVAGGDYVGDESLLTAILISLRTDAASREALDASEDRDIRGWPGDLPQDRALGGRVWELASRKQTQGVLRLAEQYATESLQWMIDEGIAAEIIAEAERVSVDRIRVRISIVRGQARGHAEAWKSTMTALRQLTGTGRFQILMEI